MNTVGIIGLGLMGNALAERLLSGGRRVIGHDLRDDCRQQLKQLGGEPVESAHSVFQAADIVVFSLPNSAIVSSLVESIWPILPGKSIIDTTTGEPGATAALGEKLFAHGTGYLDATLTGSSQVARDGDLIVTAGGPNELFQLCEPLFRLISKRWFHCGSWGSGARAKLVVNLVLGLNRAVLAEGLAFARAQNLELGAILEILRSGAAYSRVMDAKGRKMIESDFAPEAKLAQHLKDVRLILEAGRQSGSLLPLSELHEQLLAELVQGGFADADNSSIIRAFQPKSE